MNGFKYIKGQVRHTTPKLMTAVGRYGRSSKEICLDAISPHSVVVAKQKSALRKMAKKSPPEIISLLRTRWRFRTRKVQNSDHLIVKVYNVDEDLGRRKN